MDNLMNGFTDELVKTARVVPMVKKMGYFRRRRMAKILGVKPNQVAEALRKRARRKRLRQQAFTAAGLGAGAAIGSQL